MTMDDWAKHMDEVLTSSGENLLTGNGTFSHLQTMEKAQTEYKKYKAKTLSSVEKDYLESIKLLESKRETAKMSCSKNLNNCLLETIRNFRIVEI